MNATRSQVPIEVSDIVYNIRRNYRMRATTTNRTRAKNIFGKHRNMLRTSEALRLGIHPETLYSLRDSGEIEQIGRGLFRLASAPLTNPDWTAIGAQIPHAVICLVSALSHHGLTTQIPHVVDIALPSHSRVPKLQNPPIRIFWFPEPAYGSGIEMVPTDGLQIRVYSSEKTIADCFKYRNKIGLDVAIEALRTYKERTKRPNVKMLLHYAEMNRVQRIIRPYLEAMT